MNTEQTNIFKEVYMEKKQISVLLGVCLAVILIVIPFASACGPAAPSGGEPVKIGVLLPYTGINADMLPWMERSAYFAVEEFGGEVAGRPIQLILEDSATDIAPALDKARKLVESDEVDAIIGPIMSHVMLAVAEYTAESGTPTLHIAHNPGFILESENVFMHAGTLKGRAYPIGIYAYDIMGARTATVIHDDFVAGEDFTQGAMDAFVSRGGTIIQRQRTAMDTMDYAPYVTAMEQADVVFYWFIPMHAMQFVKQYYEYGLKMPMMQAGDPTFNEVIMKTIGDDSLGTIGTHSYGAGVDTPSSKAFVDRWVKKYGQLSAGEANFPALSEGIGTYIAVTTYLEAVKATGGDTTFAVVNAALRNLEWETPWGLQSFTDKGLGIGNNYIFEVVKENGRYFWKDIYVYEQAVRDIPKDIEGSAPKM